MDRNPDQVAAFAPRSGMNPDQAATWMGTQDIFKLGEQAYRSRNYEEAKQYFEQGAKLNHSQSISQLGSMYYYGKGLPKNIIKAKEYFEQAAQLNNPIAIYNLGLIYEKGYAGQKQYDKAREYYERSIELGEVSAMNNLAALIFKGYVKMDIKKGIQLLVMAYRKSGKKKYLANLRKSISPTPNMYIDIFIQEYIDVLQKNEDLQTQLDYQPGGPGYLQAKEHFQSLSNQKT